MEVGEVRPAEASDFDRLIQLAQSDTDGGWELRVKKSFCSVFTRTNELSNFKMIKVTADVSELPAATMYNALHDAKYRAVWDKQMCSSKEICVIDAENDIGYYQVKTPSPLRNRDFVTQRSWKVSGGKYMIMNHSVYHKKEPSRKGVIRGTSYYTGYVMESTGPKSTKFTYITQSNPGGNIPAWLTNKLVTVVAPKVLQRMLKASRGYESWKKKNDPEHMPWLWPDQNTTDLIDWDDVENTGLENELNNSEETEEYPDPGNDDNTLMQDVQDDS
ncbi:START domain-containing protein 10-like [Watersipora subatra]|uniref:START domain-containing protein 10-like n=1 Tax=Watersipora subatra TaxID=2589382 RepID=UPI00355B8952